MSEAREDQEAGQDVPLAVEESQQLVDAQVQPEAEEVKPEASSAPVPVEETSNHVENGNVEASAEDQTVKPEANLEGIPQQNVQNTLHSVTVEANDQILNKSECEHASDMRAEAKEFPQSNKGNENDANDSKEDVGTAETAVEVKPEACEVADGKTCNNGESMPSSHNKPMTPQSAPADTKAEIKNGLEVDNKANEKPSSHNEPIMPQSIPADAKAEIKNGLEVDNKADEKPSSHNEPITLKSIPAIVKAEIKNGLEVDNKANEKPLSHNEPITPQSIPADVKAEIKKGLEVDNKANEKPASHNEPITPQSIPADTKVEIKNESVIYNKANEKLAAAAPANKGNSNSKQLYFLDADHSYDGNESGTEEDQSAFMKELENFFRERSMEFKPPKFYGEGLNCLKLWRAVTRLGGYDKVTSCKLWRQVGESFKPPKTCTTVSWTFRGFYEKALLDYERHKTNGGELSVPIASHSEPMNIENQSIQTPGSGRARRDAAARAMQGWHSQRLLGNGEVSDPIIKDRNSMSTQKREKQLKSINLLKRKKPSYMDNAVKAARSKPSKPQLDTAVVDIGPPADWVKVNVQKTKDCFEVYALVPGLLREEVRVQSDPAGRLVISGEPEHPDNPWGVTPFKKVVSLPSRIDPHQTSAVVTLHGQLFVRVPFEQSE